jgi:hypothetical protein
MSKVVNPWQPAFGGGDTALSKQRLNRMSQSRAAIRPSTPGGVPDEGRIRGNGELSPGSGSQILIHLFGNRVIDWKQARFIELGLSNVQGG